MYESNLAEKQLLEDQPQPRDLEQKLPEIYQIGLKDKDGKLHPVTGVVGVDDQGNEVYVSGTPIGIFYRLKK